MWRWLLLDRLMAPLSVASQLTCGVLFILGAFTRAAGLICAFNFMVALIMVDAAQGMRAAFLLQSWF